MPVRRTGGCRRRGPPPGSRPATGRPPVHRPSSVRRPFRPRLPGPSSLRPQLAPSGGMHCARAHSGQSPVQPREQGPPGRVELPSRRSACRPHPLPALRATRRAAGEEQRPVPEQSQTPSSGATVLRHNPVRTHRLATGSLRGFRTVPGRLVVLIAGFPAGSWGTNCYVVATGQGAECIVVDPGMDATATVEQVVREKGLKPVAVLLTHGHIDHMFSVLPVCGTYDATAWIHPDDRHLLADPMAGMSAETTAMLLGGKYECAEPDRVEELTDAQTLELAGLEFVVDHTPGHTEGSVTFRTPYADPSTGSGQGVAEVMFSGDLLFAGSIGRTDLPGGDHPTMLRSLREKVLPLPDDVVVLPGHGEQTSIGRERATNPFLLDLVDDAGRADAPTRGL